MTAHKSPTVSPLYRQVEVHLREQIESGTLKPGDMLPPVRELCKQFGGINHLTVRQAIRNLAEEELVRSIQGKGTFVSQVPKAERCIAIVLPNLEEHMFTGIASGVQSILESEDIQTLILDSRGNWDKEAQNIRQLQNWPLDGAVIFPLAHHDIAEQIFKMKLAGFPFVLVDRYFEAIETPSVTVNNYQGGYELTHVLVEKGRRNFVWIGELVSSAAQQRMQGFRDALNDNHIPAPRECIRSLELTPANSHAEYLQFLEQGIRQQLDYALAHFQKPTLVFANDQSALLAVKLLKSQDMSVPEDAAVAGFGDRPEATLSTPALTTVRLSTQELGREAAKMLLTQMRNKSTPVERKVLPVEVILRESA